MARSRRITKAKTWNSIEVPTGQAVIRARYRMEGEMVVVEWRGGRHSEPCGCVRPDVLARSFLRRQVGPFPTAA